jgi:hypothetical protein
MGESGESPTLLTRPAEGKPNYRAKNRGQGAPKNPLKKSKGRDPRTVAPALASWFYAARASTNRKGEPGTLLCKLGGLVPSRPCPALPRVSPANRPSASRSDAGFLDLPDVIPALPRATISRGHPRPFSRRATMPARRPRFYRVRRLYVATARRARAASSPAPHPLRRRSRYPGSSRLSV